MFMTGNKRQVETLFLHLKHNNKQKLQQTNKQTNKQTYKHPNRKTPQEKTPNERTNPQKPKLNKQNTGMGLENKNNAKSKRFCFI